MGRLTGGRELNLRPKEPIESFWDDLWLGIQLGATLGALGGHFGIVGSLKESQKEMERVEKESLEVLWAIVGGLRRASGGLW